MKKPLITLSLLCAVALTSEAQHFYHRVDVGSSNLYSFVVANLASAGVNYLTNRMIVDNYYNYTIATLDDATLPNAKVKNYDIAGIGARDMFNDITGGVRLGYNSFNEGAVNWCVYGSAHYRLNQFKTQLNEADAIARHRVQRVQLGGGVMLSLGNFESHSRVVLEAGLRYDIPMGYKGAFGDKTGDVLNSGLTSHYAIRFAGTNGLQGLGVWAEIPHYNLLKSGGTYMPSPKLKMYTFGVTYSISPWKSKESYK